MGGFTEDMALNLGCGQRGRISSSELGHRDREDAGACGGGRSPAGRRAQGQCWAVGASIRPHPGCFPCTRQTLEAGTEGDSKTRISASEALP